MSDQTLPARTYLKRQADVISAIILRDLHTRFDRAAMYIVAIGWPLMHIVLILGIYSAVGRRAELGTDQIVFFTLGLLPFILFTYPCRWVAFSIPTNRMLLQIPRVQIIDIILARVILECVTAFAVAFTCIGILVLIGSSFQPDDPLELIGAFGGSLLLGIGMGVAASILAGIKPRIAMMVILLNIAAYALSGVVFMPGNLPAEIRYVLSWNPLMHGVEWAREAYYGDYRSIVLDKSYLISFGCVLLLGGLVAERLLRQRILRD